MEVDLIFNKKNTIKNKTLQFGTFCIVVGGFENAPYRTAPSRHVPGSSSGELQNVIALCYCF